VSSRRENVTKRRAVQDDIMLEADNKRRKEMKVTMKTVEVVGLLGHIGTRRFASATEVLASMGGRERSKKT
jgi:hypothetical protein